MLTAAVRTGRRVRGRIAVVGMLPILYRLSRRSLTTEATEGDDFTRGAGGACIEGQGATGP